MNLILGFPHGAKVFKIPPCSSPFSHILSINQFFTIFEFRISKQTNNIIMALDKGDKIPEILGVDQDGKEIKASDYAGKKLILYFYPKDNTPGCTAQACSLKDSNVELLKAGYEILGVSVDNEASHQKFIKKHNLPFPLVADTDKKLVEEFGVWQEKTMMGRKYMGTVRTTFLVNEQSKIIHVISGRAVNTKQHADQILELKLD